MTTTRPFRFGVQLARSDDAAGWRDLARRAEDLGYGTIFMPDHFGDQFAPFPALQAAADATSDIAVGALVMCNDYRHPVVHAKELATLDVLTGGRVEWGIGAGWMNTDYDQSGIAHDPAGVRVDRLAEAVTVMKGLFADEPLTFDGEHYRIDGLQGHPRPVQRPHPPLLLGGGGRRMLSLAAREADVVGLAPAARTGAVDATSAQDATAARTDVKLEWIREAAGDRFDDLELNMLVFAVLVSDDRQASAEAMAGLFGLDPEQALDVPHVWMGTVDQICDDLEGRRDRWGVSYLVVQADAIDAAAPVVERLTGR